MLKEEWIPRGQLGLHAEIGQKQIQQQNTPEDEEADLLLVREITSRKNFNPPFFLNRSSLLNRSLVLLQGLIPKELTPEKEFQMEDSSFDDIEIALVQQEAIAPNYALSKAKVETKRKQLYSHVQITERITYTQSRADTLEEKAR